MSHVDDVTFLSAIAQVIEDFTLNILDEQLEEIYRIYSDAMERGCYSPYNACRYAIEKLNIR